MTIKLSYWFYHHSDCSHFLQPLDLSCFGILKKGIQKAFTGAISACQIITRSDVPVLIKDAWQFAFAPEKIVAAGISPLTGLSAAKREKLSPSLAIMAAAGKRSTQLDQSELLGSAVRHEAKRFSQLQLHPLTKMQRLELENRELKRALSALKIVQSLHPEQ